MTRESQSDQLKANSIISNRYDTKPIYNLYRFYIGFILNQYTTVYLCVNYNKLIDMIVYIWYIDVKGACVPAIKLLRGWNYVGAEENLQVYERLGDDQSGPKRFCEGRMLCRE